MRDRTPHYKKSLGQHILMDKTVISRILGSIENLPQSKIMEIGAGPGNLTQELIKEAFTLLAVEIDRDFYYALSPLLEKYPEKLKFFFGDIMQFNFATLASPGNWILVGNIPYYLSSPIIEKLITDGKKVFTDFYLMLQKEVGERIAAQPGKRAYSSFSAFVQYYCDPKILFYVDAKSFTPPPQVESCFIHLKVRSKPPFEVDEKKFFPFIRSENDRRSANTSKKSNTNDITFVKENIDVLKRIVNAKGSNDTQLILDERIYGSKATYVNKNLRMNKEIYEDFANFCNKNFPGLTLQHLCSQALIDFIYKYEKSQ